MSAKRTVRERKFVKAYIENGGNATEAYLAVSPKANRKSAAELGYRMLKKVGVSVSELLDGLGVTDSYLGKILKEGLGATKVVSVVPIPPKPGKEGSPDLPEAGSKSVEFIDIPDYNVRVKYLDMAFKLKGKYAPGGVGGHADITVISGVPRPPEIKPLRVIIRRDGKKDQELKD